VLRYIIILTMDAVYLVLSCCGGVIARGSTCFFIYVL